MLPDKAFLVEIRLLMTVSLGMVEFGCILAFNQNVPKKMISVEFCSSGPTVSASFLRDKPRCEAGTEFHIISSTTS